jgi:hypothetical protein
MFRVFLGAWYARLIVESLMKFVCVQPQLCRALIYVVGQVYGQIGVAL